MRSLKIITAFLFVFFIGMSVNNISVSNSGLLVQVTSAEAAQAATTQTTNKAPSANSLKTKAWTKKQANRIKLKAITYTKETGGTPLANTFNTVAQWALKLLFVPVAVFIGLCLFLNAGITLKRLADEGRKPTIKEVALKFLVGTLVLGIANVGTMILPAENACTIDTIVNGACGMTTMTSAGELTQMISNANTGFMTMFGEFFKIAEAVSRFIIVLGYWALFYAILSLLKLATDENKGGAMDFIVKIGCAAIIIDHRHMLDMGYNFAKSMGFF